MKTPLNKAYLFYIVFLAILAIFPVMTDYTLLLFQLADFGFLTPPSDITNTWIVYGSILVLTLLFIYLFKKNNSEDKLEYLAVSVLRYTLVFAMVIAYGYAKIFYKQFEVRYSALDMPLKDVNDFDLAWYFYGKNTGETLLLGIMEFVPGLLLLSRRTTLLGAFILLPVLANVMLLDTFNDIGPHLNVFSTMFVLFDVGILLFYRNEIISTFRSTSQKLQNTFNGKAMRLILRTAKILFILLILYRLGSGIYKNTQRKSDFRNTVSKCNGIFELQSISYNNKNCRLDSLSNYWKRLYFERTDSRSTRLKDKHDSIVDMYFIFHDNKDSLTITTYKPDKDDNPITTSVFNGTYMVSDNGNTLILDGKRDKNTMHAVYKKIPVKEYNWWW